MRTIIQLSIVTLVLLGCNAQTERKKSNSTEGIVKKEVNSQELKTKKSTKSSSDKMIFVKGGTITIGNNNGSPSCKPEVEVKIKDFYLDKSPVTVGEFGEFIKQTGYKTDAEKFGNSGVFNFNVSKWDLLSGAKWDRPQGPNMPKADRNHPVTHVSWNDAVNYARWAEKRLPTEYEWEYAARGGVNSKSKFSWGNSLVVNGKYKANVWQGELKMTEKPKDGFLLTSPIGFFGETKLGLTDMGGNVWNWCGNTFHSYSNNEKVNERVKAIRGGSFMYDDLKEESFSVYGRSQNSEETSLFNLGFRCARDK